MTIIGILLVLMGGVWILQGINVLPGSFMTGQTKWAVIGAVTAVIGIALVILARRGAR
jgi:drug/metabolite transporter superfamily protein YnfA